MPSYKPKGFLSKPVMVLVTMISEQKFNDTLKTLIPAAYDAGDAIMAVFNRTHIERRYKADASPVTEADEAAEAIILKVLTTSADMRIMKSNLSKLIFLYLTSQKPTRKVHVPVNMMA